ncbi:MAG: lytic transglycosylase domain-containing protein [Deltaproteobacteria bacterium]|nr:lytic transglycosylase domain-containing protein [Deltaproteobacteria bacterium]
MNNIDKRLQAEADRTKQLTVQTAALNAEINDLHQYLASQANQDVLFLKIMVTKPELDRELARKIARLTSKYATIYRQDPDLVLAIIAIESNFNPKAVSSKGALGLMQVMPQWKTVLGITDDLTDPETSIRYGLQILGFYKQMYKKMDMALTAYNRGPGPVDMALMRGENPQNSYAPRVLKKYNLLKSMKVGKQ